MAERSFSSFGELKQGFKELEREARKRDLSRDIENARQLSVAGSPLDAADILSAHDPDCFPPNKHKTVAKCFYEAGKAAISVAELKSARHYFNLCLNLGLDGWHVHRRIQLVNEVHKTDREIESLDRWLCTCPACKLDGPSLLRTAKCKRLVNKPCKPVFQQHLSELYAVGVYRWQGDENSYNALSRMIRFMKTERADQLCKVLAKLLVEGLEEEAISILQRADCLVPVPADPGRGRDRGFNNVMDITRWIERFALIPRNTDVLRKTRATENLRHVHHNLRRSTIEGTIEVQNPNPIKGMSVLVVDDVVTTGSTLDVCAEKLLEAGAESVVAATLARSESTPMSKRWRR